MTDLRSRLRAAPTLTGSPPDWDPSQTPDSPHELFVDWLLSAIDQDVPEACATTLSTVRPGGRQSAVLTGRAEIDIAAKEQQDRIAATPDLVAPNWTLYTLHADEVEFWQADQRRRHLRLRYRLDDNWTKELLWP